LEYKAKGLQPNDRPSSPQKDQSQARFPATHFNLSIFAHRIRRNMARKQIQMRAHFIGVSSSTG
jgi:hypothetical protein